MKKILILFICILSMTSCLKTEDLFDPDRVQEEAKKNFPVQDVDPDHDWNMMGIAEMAVSVNNGTGLTYSFKVCTDNPFNIDNNARLLYQVSVKDGETKSFPFDVPLAFTDLFVAVEAPDYTRYVVPVTLKDGKFTVKIGGNTAKARSVSSRVHALSVDYTLDDAAFNCPADAKLLTNNDYVASWGAYQVQGNCYIDSDFSCSYLVISSGAHLYIKDGASLTITDDTSETMNLEANQSLSILKGGKLICDTDNGINLSGGKIYNQGTVIVTNKKGGIIMNAGLFYNQGVLDVKKGDLALSGTAKFINAISGQLTTSDNDLDVRVSSGGELLNAEDAILEVDATEISGGKWINEGKYTTQDMNITGAGYEVQNNCKLLIGTSKGNGVFTLNSEVTFSNSGYVYCKSAEFGSGEIVMTSNSIFKVDGEALYYSGFTVQGSDNDDAFLIMKSTKYASKQEVGNSYAGNLIVVCDNYFPANKNDKDSDLPGPDGFPIYSSNGLTINMPASKCSDGYQQEVTPPGSDPIPVAVYTFAFEDSSISGDYDFNDVVLKVETVPTGGRLKVKLVAAGATKNLQIFYAGQAIFSGKEVHEAMGCLPGVMINTGSATGTIAEDFISWPDGYTIKENGDFSIYDMKRQMEVKLPHFDKVGFKEGYVPYGIVVPIDWDYPMEGQRVDLKYPKFVDWARDVTQELKWYE